MNRKNIEDIYPLSPMQQGMLFHSLLAPESGMYFEQTRWTLHGSLEIGAFREAWVRVMQRHPSLRTAFLWEGVDEPLQIVFKQVNLPLQAEDWRGVPAQEMDDRLEEYVRHDRERGFALSEPPLLRLALLQTGEEEFQFVLSFQHLLLDGWSLPVLVGEILSLYEGLRTGADTRLPPARPYREYISWIRGQDMAEAERYWKDLLEGFSAPTPLLGVNGLQQEPHREDYRILKDLLSSETSLALRNLAREQVTLNTIVQGAWSFLLGRYGGVDDVLFGATVSGRPPDLPGAETIVGLCINTLPVRVRVPSATSVISWLRDIQSRQGESRLFEYVPLVDIHGWSDIPNSIPMFESILVFENYPRESIPKKDASHIRIEQRNAFARTNYPVTVVVSPGDVIGLELAYDSRSIDGRLAEGLLRHFRNVLEQFAADPNKTVAEVSLLTPEEEHLVVHDWNATAAPFPSDRCVHELIAAQAVQTPDEPAVLAGETSLTYAELNRKANQVAHHLMSRGVSCETRVGVCIERSPEMIVALIGVLKSGAAYLPLDPDTPPQRMEYMLTDSHADILVTQDLLRDRFHDSGATIICIDTDWHTISGENDQDPVPVAVGENAAYVIYTSGSTGRPKGVAVPHRGLVNHAVFTVKALGLSVGERVMQFLSISFDAAAEEVYPTLISGGALVLLDEPYRMSGRELLTHAEESGVSVLHLPVAYWHQMVSDLDASGGKAPRCLKTLVVGGESPSPEKLQRWVDLTEGRVAFINAYGPTETTVAATMYKVEDPARLVEEGISGIPIGKPIPNVQVYLLDSDFRPVPVGAVGNLFIGGVGVARGYLDRPDATAEKFVPHPLGDVPGTRLYDTGDLARYLPDGNIEFLGRRDNQVKVRGFRIELGEIESKLHEHPDVAEAAVVVHDGEPGERQLVAYVTPRPDSTLEPTGLREFLRSELPDYMIPGAILVLKEFPLTSTGKLDRRALPAPEESVREEEDVRGVLRTPTEEMLADIWKSILGVRRVHSSDNFFDLGGHSLRATQMLSRINDIFAVDLPLRTVFDSPSLSALARAIDSVRLGVNEGSAPSLEPVSRDQDLPLSFAQQRLWFIDQFSPGGSFYNIASAYRLTGSLSVPVLENTLNEIVRRHEVLRTHFRAIGGKPVQVIRPFEPMRLSIQDLTGSGEEEREQSLTTLLREEASQPFDLKEGPLFRVTLIRLRNDEHVIAFTVHHIVADGWSMGVLVHEVSLLYHAFHQENVSPLSELPVQYADYAFWQSRWLQGEMLESQLSFWKEALAGIPAVHELPTDFPRPAVQTFRGGRLNTTLSKEVSERVVEVSRAEGVTVFMTLLAAFQTFLHRYSGNPDIVVGSPIAGRKQTDAERLIGFFVNNLTLRTQFLSRDTFRTVLQRVRETALGAYGHQDIPFEKLVEELQPARDLSHSPLFQVMFVLQNVPIEEIELPGLTMRGLESMSTTSNYDLTLQVQESPEGFVVQFEYNADLFTSPTISRMLEHFTTLVAALVRNPDARVASDPLLTPEERNRQLVEWNRTNAPYPEDLCVHKLFEQIVEGQSGDPALTYTDGAGPDRSSKLTYDELNRRGNQLAHYLRGLGVGPESLVGVCTERSIEMVIGILGTLKAGGAFVPLDPAYPQDRLSFMVEDSGVTVLLTQESLVSSLPQSTSRVVRLDSDWPVIAQQPVSNLSLNTVPDSLAYVIYTSGSTGRPKGTMLRHGGLCNLATVHRREFEVGPGSKILQFSSLSFDASVWEFVMALLNGATLCLAGRDIIGSGHALVDFIRAEAITTVTLPPSVLSVFPHEQLSELRTIIVAGEKCPGELVEKWGAGRKFFDAYGPTETTVCASMHLCSGRYPQGPPIGLPIANFQLYVLDANMQPVPVGVPGELHIGGVGLARGYLRRPGVTAERFVPNPFSESAGSRLYKSGDLCRQMTDGTVEFLGRVDHQVKVRGFRIELGEIESVLAHYPGIRDSVVLAREDTPGDKKLVAYMVPESDERPDAPDLKSFLKEKLPDYMVPSSYVILDEMPLTPNKKVDRKALPAPDQSRAALETEYVAPRNEVETTLAEITASLLNLERAGVYDNFFDLGGHSLLATQFVSRVRDAFGVEVTLRALFEKPSVAEMALEIERLKAMGEQSHAPKIKVIERDSVRVKRSQIQQTDDVKKEQ
jgi:amino acid adenylation domain-containing protein